MFLGKPWFWFLATTQNYCIYKLHLEKKKLRVESVKLITFHWLQSKKLWFLFSGFPETLIALILKDIISAISYIHSQHFVHGSIKAQHILLNSKKAILTNFCGCRTFIKHGKIEKCLYGSTNGNEMYLNWTAPEVLHQNLHGYTEKIDIYSIGITCCEMANGFQPFKDTEPTLMYTDKIRGNMSLVLDSFRINDTKGNDTNKFYFK